MDQAAPEKTNYTIREVAALSGLPVTTLRYYEQIELLAPVGRDASSGHRRYSEDDLSLAVAVACLQATGMGLDEMRAYLTNRLRGAAAAPEQLALLTAQQRRVQAEARSLELRQAYLDAKVAYWLAVAAGDQERQSLLAQQVTELAARVHDFKPPITPNPESETAA